MMGPQDHDEEEEEEEEDEDEEKTIQVTCLVSCLSQQDF